MKKKIVYASKTAANLFHKRNTLKNKQMSLFMQPMSSCIANTFIFPLWLKKLVSSKVIQSTVALIVSTAHLYISHSNKIELRRAQLCRSTG